MKLFFISIFLILSSLSLFGQNCSILSKANNITPDKLCSPVTAIWNVSYTGVNNAGTPVSIRYDWNNGVTQTVAAIQLSPGVFQATAANTYTSSGAVCNYHPQATLVVNGVVCSSSIQEQIVTVWDDDDHNGGLMHINPTVYPICFGNSANVRFQDLTQFNCVPPQENDNPNVNTRWLQWIYGTDITMTGTPVKINGIIRSFPYRDNIITLSGPVTGSGVWSEIMNVANDKSVGQYFQVTLRNWNYCNPYDDPTIPGPPSDLVNGDHPPVVTTAIILIVSNPDATITPVGNLCVNSNPATLSAHDPGGIWSGNGVTGNTFNPTIAGVGSHIIRYDISNASGCSDYDEITIIVVPKPDATITPVGNLCLNGSPVNLSAHDPGGIWSGPGVAGNSFNPTVAGVGNQIIRYDITNANGCHDYNEITVTVVPKPDATITPIGNLCVNSNPVTLTAHDPGGIWSGTGVTGNIFNPAIAGIGNHLISYNIVNANGCSDNDQITVTVMPKPDATITPVGTLCVNSPIITLSSHDSGGIWSGPGVLGNSFNPAMAGVGNHLIRYDITNASGCSDNSQITITVVPLPDATITPVDTICVQDNPVILSAHDPGGTWSGTGVINGKFDPALAGIGNHFIRYNITNANGCNDFDQITVTVMPLLPTIINPVGTLYVNSPPVGLTASPPGGTWSGNGVINSMFDPGSAGIGNHVVTYQTLVDKWGCKGIDTIHIKVIMPPLPVADFEPDTVGCSPLSVQFRNMSLTGESYLWEFGDKTYSTEKTPSHIYYIPGNYIVKLTVFNIAGKSSHVGLTKVYQNPTAIFDAYPTNIVNNEQVVVFYNNSYYDSLHLWRFGDGQTSDEKNPYHKYLTAGTYNVSLLVTSKDGCTDSSILRTPITVDWKIGALKFPNVFKWNQSGPTGGQWREGVNPEMDFVFRPFFENVIEYKLQIFNRWGVLVYESYDLYKGWDGYTADGNLAVQGVYVWKVNGRYADGNYFVKVGDVTFLH
jgi:PKD repeat protein